jgi:hypothetical protein
MSMLSIPDRCSAPLRTVAAVAVFCLVGCDFGPDGTPGSGSLTDPVRPGDPALAWVGVFRGEGAGISPAGSVEWSAVALRIREDADSVAVEGCDPCLTVSLDTLFRAMNVRAPSDVELVAVHEGNGEVRTLQLLRYSGAGGVANFVDATLRVERGSETSLEARFLLNR